MADERQEPKERLQVRRPRFPLRHRAVVLMLVSLVGFFPLAGRALSADSKLMVGALFGWVLFGVLLSVIFLRCPSCGWLTSLSHGSWATIVPGRECSRCGSEI